MVPQNFEYRVPFTRRILDYLLPVFVLVILLATTLLELWLITVIIKMLWWVV